MRIFVTAIFFAIFAQPVWAFTDADCSQIRKQAYLQYLGWKALTKSSTEDQSDKSMQTHETARIALNYAEQLATLHSTFCKK